jgi:hypothetical protein
MDKFPTITDLFEFLSDDPEWHKLSQIHEEVYPIIDKLLDEFRPYLYKYQKEDIPDYRHYLFIFLYRTLRISHSINHLYIFGLINEAMMLERPLLENIVNTKIFIKSGHRAKSMKKIRLFELINERKSYDYRIKDVKIYDQKYGITTAYIQEADQNLKERVEKGLQRFPAEAIEKAEKSINYGWHGEAPINAFKKCNMESYYYLTYNIASSLLHVREIVPFGFLDHNEREIHSKLNLSQLLDKIIFHLMDFKDICSNSFNNHNLNETIKKIQTRNTLLFISMCKEYKPKLGEFIKIE